MDVTSVDQDQMCTKTAEKPKLSVVARLIPDLNFFFPNRQFVLMASAKGSASSLVVGSLYNWRDNNLFLVMSAPLLSTSSSLKQYGVRRRRPC